MICTQGREGAKWIEPTQTLFSKPLNTLSFECFVAFVLTQLIWVSILPCFSVPFRGQILPAAQSSYSAKNTSRIFPPQRSKCSRARGQ